MSSDGARPPLYGGNELMFCLLGSQLIVLLDVIKRAMLSVLHGLRRSDQYCDHANYRCLSLLRHQVKVKSCTEKKLQTKCRFIIF